MILENFDFDYYLFQKHNEKIFHKSVNFLLTIDTYFCVPYFTGIIKFLCVYYFELLLVQHSVLYSSFQSMFLILKHYFSLLV